MSITVHVSLPWQWLPQCFPPVSCCSDKAQIPEFTCLSVSPVLGVVVCPVFSPLMDLRRGVYFFVCSVFYLFLGQSGQFLTPYIGNWKVEVHKLTLNNRTLNLRERTCLSTYLVNRGISCVLWTSKQSILSVLSIYFRLKSCLYQIYT